MDTIGERLDYIRKEKGKSYQALADLVGDISGDAIRKAIKRNNIKDYYINVLSEKLGINKKWLKTGEGNIYNNETQKYDLLTIEESNILDKLVTTNEEGLLKHKLFSTWFKLKLAEKENQIHREYKLARENNK